MILYHGSRETVETPDLLHSRKNVDFGPGFEKPNMQICFRTGQALSCLHFKGSEEI